MVNDPFAEPSDDERTVIRPRPAGQAAAPQAPARPAAAPQGSTPGMVPKIGLNPLVAAASPVLSAVIRIAGGRGRNPDPEQLKRGMVDAIRDFEKQALATNLDTRSLRAARYAVCATVDDVVLNTPWGSASSWTQQSVTSIFHNEVIGGDRFFEIVEQMQKDLGHHFEVVELMYLCASLGFEGRYRVMARGIAALTEWRDSVYRTIRTRRGEFERELSPHWKGLSTGYKPLSQRIPFWAMGLVTLLLAILIYLGFNFALAANSDMAFTEIYGLPPSKPAEIIRTAVPTPANPTGAPTAAPPPPPPVVQSSSLSDKLHQFLAPEIKAGLVVVFEDAQSVTVRITAPAMFASGEAVINKDYLSLINRIGEALQDEQGDVLINGYTDNQPIRTVRFPSNFQLSQSRADAVAQLISAKLADAKRVKATGKADADPVASNATPAGRQQNRRTEVVLVRPATP